MSDKILKVNNLSFYYDVYKNILNNISIEFETNTVTAILGCNGSGKSTLLDCIIGFNKYYSGNILLFDKNIRDYSLDILSKVMTYLPQQLDKLIEFKVFDFLLFGRTPYISVSSIPKKNENEKVLMYAEKTGIKNLLNKNLNQLSGGEKQLVRITRSLVQETEIILLDEPTASLDFGNQYKILELIKLLSEEGKTIIFTIHNPNQLIEYNYNTVVLNNSKVIAKGEAKKVINDDIIKQVYGSNFEIKNDKCQLIKESRINL